MKILSRLQNPSRMAAIAVPAQADAGQPSLETVFPIPCSQEVVGNRNFSVTDICLSPCGAWLAVQFANRIVVYQTRTFRERLTIENTNARSHKRWTGTFSADGTMFATSVSAGDKTVGSCRSDCTVWAFDTNPRWPGGSWEQMTHVYPAGACRITSADIGTDGAGFVTLLCITLSNSTFELYHIAPGRSTHIATQNTQTIPLSCRIARTPGMRDTYVVVGCKTKLTIFNESDIFAARTPGMAPRFAFSHVTTIGADSAQALSDMQRTDITQIISATIARHGFMLTGLFTGPPDSVNLRTLFNFRAMVRFFGDGGALQHLWYTPLAGKLVYCVRGKDGRTVSDPLMLHIPNMVKCAVSDDGTTLVAHVRSDSGANCLRRYSLAGPKSRMLVLIMAGFRARKAAGPSSSVRGRLRLPAELWLLIHNEFLATEQVFRA